MDEETVLQGATHPTTPHALRIEIESKTSTSNTSS